MERSGLTYTISIQHFVGVPWRNTEIFAKVSETSVSVVMNLIIC
jgi:hypothetical protein